MNEVFIPNQEEIKGLIKLAEENLELAKLEFQQGFIRGAISKAYYVFLNIARAALLSKGIIPKTHTGAIVKFAETFIKSGQISKDYGHWFIGH